MQWWHCSKTTKQQSWPANIPEHLRTSTKKRNKSVITKRIRNDGRCNWLNRRVERRQEETRRRTKRKRRTVEQTHLVDSKTTKSDNGRQKKERRLIDSSATETRITRRISTNITTTTSWRKTKKTQTIGTTLNISIVIETRQPRLVEPLVIFIRQSETSESID